MADLGLLLLKLLGCPGLKMRRVYGLGLRVKGLRVLGEQGFQVFIMAENVECCRALGLEGLRVRCRRPPPPPQTSSLEKGAMFRV